MPDNRSATTVAVIGVGIMGAAMAANLLDAGIPTVVWDRSDDATAALAGRGASAAASAAEAAAGADVVITMLPTLDIVREVMVDGGALDALGDGAVWAQMGTIGVEGTLELARTVAERRPEVRFVDAPVSGSRGPAEKGELLILASGPEEAAAALEAAFGAIGRRAVWVGEVGDGSRLKLVLNAYMATLIEGVAETLALADRLGVDRAKLEEAVEGGPLDSPIADAKMHKMEQGDYSPEFPLEWALKDVDLALAAADGVSLPVLAALAAQWHEAVDAGHGRKDVSAARLALP